MTTQGKLEDNMLRPRRFVLGLLLALGCTFTGAVQGDPAPAPSTTNSAATAAASPWQFEDDRLPERIGMVTLPGFVSLQPIMLHELTQSLRSASSSVSEGNWQAGRAGAQGGSLKTSLSAHEGFQIHRELPALWRLRLPNDGGSFNVSYEVIAANGRSGRLSHPGSADSEIRVTARPLYPRIVDGNDDTTVYEGGVDLKLNLGDAQVAGEHSGTVTITLSWL